MELGLSSRTDARAQLTVAVALVATSLAMIVVPLELDEVRPACIYHAEILCAELAVSAAQLSDVFDGPSTPAAVWRYHLLIDFAYLVLYGTLFGAAFVRERARGAAALVVAGALCDVVENVALLRALDGARVERIVSVAATAASLKFLLLALGVAAGFAHMARTRRGWRRALYIGLALFAAVGLFGPLSPWALELGALALLPASLTLIARVYRLARAD